MSRQGEDWNRMARMDIMLADHDEHVMKLVLGDMAKLDYPSPPIYGSSVWC